jgi:tetratricopeptide (TPR) repeat protein
LTITSGPRADRSLGGPPGIAFSLRHLGVTKHYQRETRRAVVLLEQSLAHFREIGRVEGTVHALAGLGNALGHEGNPERALSLFRESPALSEKHGIEWTIDYSLPLSDQIDYERTLSAIRAALSEAAFGAALAEGRAMTLEQAIEYALAGETD